MSQSQQSHKHHDELMQQQGPLSRPEMQRLSEVGALPSLQEAMTPKLTKAIAEETVWLNGREPRWDTPKQRRRRIRALRFRRVHYETKRAIHDGPLVTKYGTFFATTIVFATILSHLLMRQVDQDTIIDTTTHQFLVHLTMAFLGSSALMLGWVGLGHWFVPDYYRVDPKMVTPKVRLRFQKRKLAAIRKIDLLCDAVEHLQAAEAARARQ